MNSRINDVRKSEFKSGQTPASNSHFAKSKNSTTTKNEGSPQSTVLDMLTPNQRVDVLKFAQIHNIQPNDPTWILVDMLGHVRFATETLPARIEAAGQNTVQALQQQREVEQRAFSAMAMQEIDRRLKAITERVAIEASTIYTAKNQALINVYRLAGIGCMGLVMAVSYICGYVFAGGRIFWMSQAHSNFFSSLGVILNLPIGFLIIPAYVLAVIVLIRYWWRR